MNLTEVFLKFLKEIGSNRSHDRYPET